MRTIEKRPILCALLAAGLATPALADTSGSGAAFGVKAGSESVTILTTYQSGQVVVHVRNVGSRPVKVTLVPQCGPGSACGSPATVSVKPVGQDGDSGQDAIVSFPSAVRTFTWTIAAP